MSRRGVLGALILCTWMAGCGGGRTLVATGRSTEGPSSRPRGGAAMVPVSPATEDVAAERSEAQAPARAGVDDPARPSARSTAAAPATRPGLGTEWGETRTSPVHDEAFERDDALRPFAVTTLYYNDRAGVEALARYHGGYGPTLRATTTRGGWLSVSVQNDAGNAFETFLFGNRNYVVGQAGESYRIVITNHTARRIEAVASVDGLDVIDGRAASVSNRGYLLRPWGTLVIDGFRRSHSTVAAFRFGSVGNSYAGRVGDARDVGVIGVAFFAERGDIFDETELRTRDTANPFPGDGRFAQPPPSR